MTQQAYSERSIIQGGPPLEVTLIDGTTVPYRLSMDSLAALERSFGSLDQMQARLQGALAEYQDPDKPAGDGQIKVMQVVTDMVAMGVRHVPFTDPVTGEAGRLGTRPQLVAENLDPARLQEYMTVVGKALQQAFGSLGGGVNPPVPASPQDAAPPAAGAPATPSPGDAGTTSPPWSTGGQMPPFGI